MAEKLEPRNLLYTERGKKWLEQFSPIDRELAEKLVSSLTLVSHSEFERSIQARMEKEVAQGKCPVAFYAVREINSAKHYFDQLSGRNTNQLCSLTSGTDHGSEARIAAMIRNYCKTDPDNLLNHPTIDNMRSARCRRIIFVDDFIGSGERTWEFVQEFWREASLASWRSLDYLRFFVVTYSGTVSGIRRVERHKARVKVIKERDCPTFLDMPWQSKRIVEIVDFCKRYGCTTSQGYWWDGYGSIMAALIFEHGCPDNAPAVLWAPNEPNKPWIPLFPDRVVLAGQKSAFPLEIARRDPVTVLLDAGQQKLAKSGALQRRGEMGETILLILALISKGQRKQSALSFATALDERSCAEIVERCIRWGFVTRTRRLTKKGFAELEAAKRQKMPRFDVPTRGEEYYYPKQLRRTTRG